jgi:hypothetical protein
MSSDTVAFCALNCKGGANTVSLTLFGGVNVNYNSFSISEWSGVNAVGSFNAAGSTASGSSAPATSVVTQANSLLVGVITGGAATPSKRVPRVGRGYPRN